MTLIFLTMASGVRGLDNDKGRGLMRFFKRKMSGKINAKDKKKCNSNLYKICVKFTRSFFPCVKNTPITSSTEKNHEARTEQIPLKSLAISVSRRANNEKSV